MREGERERERESYLKNYFISIKFIIFAYIQFNEFSKNNLKKFGIYQNKLSFPLKILIIIFFKQFTNKLHIIFYFYKRKNFYINFINKNLNNENKLIISAPWFIKNAYHWHNVFKKFSIYEKKLEILEIGSFEGYSSLYFFENFPNSTVTCVDMWQNNEEQKKFDLTKVEINFDKNTQKYKSNLKKYKQSSDQFFKNTKDIINYYDIIYVDGDHYYETVFRDVMNSFKALKVGGIMILDDFIGYNFYKKYNENPIGAIVVFINIYYTKINILKITNQIMIQKISN
jgi:hypothetical protein